MRQPFSSMLRVRIPDSLHARLDATADRAARTHSDLAREALVIGLERLSRQYASDQSPQAA